MDNQAFNGDTLQMAGDCGPVNLNLNYENSKKVLIASRHLRNDSRTIQLEQRYDITEKAAAVKSKQHYRSSSCDVKITRSGSRGEYDRKPQTVGHSRTNSRDLCAQDFRQKLTHSRNNSNDHQNSNIKFILNYLNTPKVIVPTSSSKRHSRNHSYDQIYMPNNIKIDLEFQKKFKKNLEKPKLSSKDDVSAGVPTVRQHSRNNSKDLNLMNIQLAEDAMGKSCLRHRRTSSKDLGRITLAPVVNVDDLAAIQHPEDTSGVATIIRESPADNYEDVI